MPNTVIVTREPPIAVVQLNRPEVLNALNEEVLDELVRALTALDDDDAIRCVVLTGSEKAFAAGADIKENFVTATPVTMLKRIVILTRFPVLSAILPPMSCDMPDASELTACTYPMSRSLAPDEVTLNPTKGLATLFANEFQKV